MKWNNNENDNGERKYWKENNNDINVNNDNMVITNSNEKNMKKMMK